MNLKLTIGDQVLIAALEDNATGRDFVSLLPLTLALKDYASTEKISNLPKRLSIQGARMGSVARAGDISYYAPWGNLALFYRDFEYARGLVKIGHIKGDITPFMVKGPVAVRIEWAARDQDPIVSLVQQDSHGPHG